VSHVNSLNYQLIVLGELLLVLILCTPTVGLIIILGFMNEIGQKTPNESTKFQAVHKLCIASQNTASVDSTLQPHHLIITVHVHCRK